MVFETVCDLCCALFPKYTVHMHVINVEIHTSSTAGLQCLHMSSSGRVVHVILVHAHDLIVAGD